MRFCTSLPTGRRRVASTLCAAMLLSACAAPHRIESRSEARHARSAPTAAPVAVAPRPSRMPTVASSASPTPNANGAPALPRIQPTTRISVAAEPTATVAAATPAVDDERDLRAAQEALQQSYQFTGLTDTQLARQKAAEALLVQGQSGRALAALRQLNDELRTGNKAYVVQSGDSLWIISGKSEIYGNPWLWPLIWQNNLQVLPNPDRIASGQALRIKPNPTIEEVVKAVDYARAQTQRSQTRIGEIKDAAP